jgi:hypothetical protein
MTTAAAPDDALSRVGEGLRSIKQVPELAGAGAARLRSLNLHGNALARIDGLDALAGLAALNLSSNALTSLGGGLQQLAALTSLNLASNRLADVGGLGACMRLTALNLAYNDLADLQGLTQLYGAPLERLDLQHNRISGLQALAVLTGFGQLRQLRVAGNAACSSAAAYEALKQALPQARQPEALACGRPCVLCTYGGRVQGWPCRLGCSCHAPARSQLLGACAAAPRSPAPPPSLLPGARLGRSTSGAAQHGLEPGAGAAAGLRPGPGPGSAAHTRQRPAVRGPWRSTACAAASQQPRACGAGGGGVAGAAAPAAARQAAQVAP